MQLALSESALGCSAQTIYMCKVARQLIFIECSTGDLSKPNLGLKPDVYRELAQSLDTVIHNGALVNHAFTYEQFFEPNVLGSLEVQHLASSCTWKDTIL